MVRVGLDTLYPPCPPESESESKDEDDDYEGDTVSRKSSTGFQIFLQNTGTPAEVLSKSFLSYWTGFCGSSVPINIPQDSNRCKS